MTIAETSAFDGWIAQDEVPPPTSQSKTSPTKSAPTDKPSSATVQDNAFPDRIRRKYYVVVNESGKDGPDGEARLYADQRREYLAFKVTDDRLVTRLAAVVVIRDMISVAQHRQWDALQRPRLRGIPARGVA